MLCFFLVLFCFFLSRCCCLLGGCCLQVCVCVCVCVGGGGGGWLLGCLVFIFVLLFGGGHVCRLIIFCSENVHFSVRPAFGGFSNKQTSKQNSQFTVTTVKHGEHRNQGALC